MKITTDILQFKQKVDSMVGINQDSYNRNATKRIQVSTYTTDEIIDIVETGNPDSVIALSQKFIATSGMYQRILTYFSTFLTNDVFITPKKTSTKSIKANKYLENYKFATFFADTVINPKLVFPHIVFTMLVNGAYFGILTEQGEDEVVIRDLPYTYCRSRFKNYQNINILEMDMSYFDTFTDAELKKKALESFPKEIQKGYAAFKKDYNQKWYVVNPEYGIAFYFEDQNKPYFISMLPAISRLNDYKKLEESLDKQELERILVQKVPITKEGTFMLDLDEAAELHQGVVNMLQNNQSTDVLTTLCDIELLNVSNKTQTDRDNLEKVERSVYNEAGTSRLLFAGDSASAINDSLVNDMTFVLALEEQLVNWLTYQVNLRYSEKSKYCFEVCLLPISHYNKKDMLELYLKSAQFGFSKILVAIAAGTKQSAFLDLMELENTILDLGSLMSPLQSSNTQSGDAGRPELETKQKSQKTIDNIESK